MTTLLAEKAYARAFQKSSRNIVRTTRSVRSANYKGIWGSRTNRSLEHALGQIKREWVVDRSARVEMERILKASLRDASAYATITPDGDGGLLAQWRAGRSYLTIEINQGEAAFTYANADGKLEVNEVTVSQLDARPIKAALAKFTTELVEANPQWRKLFL